MRSAGFHAGGITKGCYFRHHHEIVMSGQVALPKTRFAVRISQFPNNSFTVGYWDMKSTGTTGTSLLRIRHFVRVFQPVPSHELGQSLGKELGFLKGFLPLSVG